MIVLASGSDKYADRIDVFNSLDVISDTMGLEQLAVLSGMASSQTLPGVRGLAEEWANERSVHNFRLKPGREHKVDGILALPGKVPNEVKGPVWDSPSRMVWSRMSRWSKHYGMRLAKLADRHTRRTRCVLSSEDLSTIRKTDRVNAMLGRFVHNIAFASLSTELGIATQRITDGSLAINIGVRK